jgi:hypothetical protein
MTPRWDLSPLHAVFARGVSFSQDQRGVDSAPVSMVLMAGLLRRIFARGPAAAVECAEHGGI